MKRSDLLLLLAMTLLFGITFVAVKMALEGLGVFQVIFLRYLLALAVLAILFFPKLRTFTIPRSDWKWFALLTGIEPIGYFILETYGIQFSSPAIASLIIATIPVFSLVFARFLLAEKQGWPALLGILISITGVYFIARLQDASTLAPRPMLGNLLIFGAAISAGLYNCLSRRMSFRYSPLAITFYQSVAAVVVFLPLALWELHRGEIPEFTSRVIGSVMFLGIGGSVLAYFLLNFMLSRLETARVAVFANLIPVVTLLVSFAMFREMLTFGQIAGAAMVVAGVYLTQWEARRRTGFIAR